MWTAVISGFSFCISYRLLPAKPQYSTSRSWGFSSPRPLEAKRFPMMDRGPCRAEVYRKQGLFSLRRKRIIDRLLICLLFVFGPQAEKRETGWYFRCSLPKGLFVGRRSLFVLVRSLLTRWHNCQFSVSVLPANFSPIRFCGLQPNV